MLKFNEIKDVRHIDFKEAMEIYIDSFPPQERHTEGVIEKRAREKLYKIFVGRLERKVVFIALLYPLKNTRYILLDYMATLKDFRNKGIGAKFMKTLYKELENNNSCDFIIFEVENPAYGDNRENKEKRIEFYKRAGAKELKNVRYVLPPLSGDVPTEMMLMVLPKIYKKTIDGNMVKEVIIQIYRELYNRDRTDVLLNSFIHQITSDVELI